MSVSLKTLAAALLLGGAATAMAANDGQTRVNELLNSDPQYRETWQEVVEKEERLPEWVMNLSGDAQQMNAVEEDGDKYLVGPLCDRGVQFRQEGRLRHVGRSAGGPARGQVADPPCRIPLSRQAGRWHAGLAQGTAEKGPELVLS